MQASVGDRLVIKGHHVGEPDRDAEILEIHERRLDLRGHCRDCRRGLDHREASTEQQRFERHVWLCGPERTAGDSSQRRVTFDPA